MQFEHFRKKSEKISSHSIISNMYMSLSNAELLVVSVQSLQFYDFIIKMLLFVYNLLLPVSFYI